MEKKIYSQPLTKLISLASHAVCEETLISEAPMYGGPTDPLLEPLF